MTGGAGGFRRLDAAARRAFLAGNVEKFEELILEASDATALGELAGLMVESPLGFWGVPLGIASGFVVDGQERFVPLATEEPSVVAAASFAAGLIAHGGGFVTEASEPIVTAQVWLERVPEGGERGIDAAQEAIKARVNGALESLVRRGGGFRSVAVERLEHPDGIVRVHVDLDVRDAMGANLANTAAESIAGLLEEVSGGRALARILTNESEQRTARASFRISPRILRRNGIEGAEMARRIVLFSGITALDRPRAITNNKGIMNGISALALATGNDTRAVEAAAHAWAGRSGKYLPLARYRLAEGELCGEIEVPTPLGTASSTAGLHPGARLALAILGQPDAGQLARIAAAVGLAQNLAALAALVGEGIQAGHMKLHARRTAWLAGARGDEIGVVAQTIHAAGSVTLAAACAAVARLRERS